MEQDLVQRRKPENKHSNQITSIQAISEALQQLQCKVEMRTCPYNVALKPSQGSLPASNETTLPVPAVGPKWRAKLKPRL
jgi:hypothetical protein